MSAKTGVEIENRTATCGCGGTACAPGDAETAPQAALVRVAKALADPIRLEMLRILAQGRGCCDLPDPATRNVPGAGTPEGICVCEFQEQFGLGQSKTSYHLRVLKEAGLISEEKRGKWSFYALEPEVAEQALSDLRALLRA